VLLTYPVLTGALIKEIDTGVGGTTVATTNGLFAPTGWDDDSSGTVDYVYAGDLQGHVWKFDLSSSTSSSWTVGNGGESLFTATDSDGTAQPITGGMLVAEKSSTGDTWVFFGTGKYIESDDLEDTSVQTLYGVIDESEDSSGTTLTRSSLTSRGLHQTTSTSTSETVRSFDTHASLPSGSDGWYVDLVVNSDEEGERIISTPLSYGSYLIVSSVIPSSDGCTSNGTGWVYSLDMFTGTSSSTSYFDLDGNGSTSNDTTALGTSVGGVSTSSGMASVAALLNGKLVVGDSSGSTTTKSTITATSSRVSWREIRKED
jgi:type IV pilus assembly protein PilY1